MWYADRDESPLSVDAKVVVVERRKGLGSSSGDEMGDEGME